ncbi:type II toxin-antitoxin system RelE/ParE family toxin [Rhizobium sp. C4]|uniref:type II toxin-antitoxin system RelE/ParE family toxin n=1 Tax=Rhizobium sp. C4 TaxID=1349800 RepID=UPI001E623BEA|nr:type II toxin-antitoxin system RelE/ParE family toxin [Rhizobium sp. C4]MCD2172845.1 type II toxin-antitoxin system RelE/ParE family toxin [Rhizobium sp. C4]
MPSGRPKQYVLTPRASDDFEAIWLYTAETWSVEQADAYTDDLTRIFDLLVKIPEMAREYREFSPHVRIHTHRSHVIVYLVEGDNVLIVRILGGQQDWRTILNSIDP